MTSSIRRVVRAYFTVGFALCAWIVTGCALQTIDDAGDPLFIYVTLRTGPQSATQTPERRQEIFKGHMANIHRLADRGRLVVAGPFDKPHDESWRGIFVIDERTIEAARTLVATDPGVAAGVFVPEFTPMRASSLLRETLFIERAQTKAAAEANDVTKPPPNVRAYVMVTAESADRARRGIRTSPLSDRIVWSGLFVGPRAGAGVFVLDAETPAEVEAALAKVDVGKCVVDGWWSTTALVKLPKEAGR